MINTKKEKLIPMTEARKHLPQRRRGKKLSRKAIYGWATRGVRGVRLAVQEPKNILGH